MGASLEEAVAQARLGSSRSDLVVTIRVPCCVVADSRRIHGRLTSRHRLRFLGNDVESSAIPVASVLRAETSLATSCVQEWGSAITARSEAFSIIQIFI